MITITRRTARQLRDVLRPEVLDLPRSGPEAYLVFRAGRAGLRVRYAGAGLALECLVPAPARPREAVVVPLDLLRRFEARDDGPVILAGLGGETLASWDLDTFPENARAVGPRPRELPLFPRLPERMHPAPADVLDLLADASRAAGLGGLVGLGGGEVRPAGGGHEGLLLPEGCNLPWAGVALVPASSAYRALGRQPGAGLAITRTSSHVVLRRGAWSAWLAAAPAVDAPAPVGGVEPGH